HPVLVLGAWGCGVFGNDPAMAADSFGTWLESSRFRASFARVVFAVYDPAFDKPSFTAFSKRLLPRP
ncbi:MAG: TIGR02452 family protein, partial [Myxococcales bacterium]|nr:TIGR02452 family protein [Myxococcales bacterium]